LNILKEKFFQGLKKKIILQFLSNFYEHLKRTKKIKKEQTGNTKISFDFSYEYLF